MVVTGGDLMAQDPSCSLRSGAEAIIMAGNALPGGSDSRPASRDHGILTVIEVAAELRCSKATSITSLRARCRAFGPCPLYGWVAAV